MCLMPVNLCVLAADGQPLRPALLWMDMRSADQAAQVLATGDILIKAAERLDVDRQG
jgi:sugar (pentulose or hexulose) kinase